MAAAKSPNARGRLEFLDSLRGLAAISVVWSHYTLAYVLPPTVERVLTYSPLHLLWDGTAAVSFFFVLSGFVLALKFFKESQPTSYFSYLISRLGRIWLPYVVIIASSSLIKAYAFADHQTEPAQTEWVKAFWRSHTGLWDLVREANLFVRPTLFTLAPQAWSLFTEMTLSLFLPAAVAIARRSLFQLGVLVLLLPAALDAPVFVLHFAMGLLLAQQYLASAGKWSSIRPAWKVGLLSVALYLYGFRFLGAPHLPMLNDGRSRSDDVINLITAVGSVGVLFVALSSARLQAFLHTGLVRHLGKVSYSIYLCHFVILLTLTPLFIEKVNTHSVAGWPTAWFSGLVFLTVTTALVSTFLHRWVETPSLSLSKRVTACLLREVS